LPVRNFEMFPEARLAALGSTGRAAMTGLIFMVESDPSTTRLVRHCLETAGYDVRISSLDPVKEAEEHRPSLILISANVTDQNGLDLCRCFRHHPLLGRTPIVLLMSGDAEEDRVFGLDSGADDCITKPFSPRELIARVQAVLRRVPKPRPFPITESADIVIDNAAMKVSVKGNEVETTTLEFRLVDYLARHRGHVFTRDVLLDAVWGEMQFVTPRSVDACIRRVRDKIEPDRSSPTFLKTVRGVGYRFDGVAVWPRSNDPCSCLACTPSRGPMRIPQAGARRVKTLSPTRKSDSQAS
jgi:two-component system, OmpR family, phosphate regulon response regulator PhoB